MIDPFSKEAYDECYLTSEKYKQHYKDVIYFEVWNCVLNKFKKTDKILELGCGPGHLANMFHDNGYETYIGIDFSKVAIEQAKIRAPKYIFIEADLQSVDYNQYNDFYFISIETFEHLEDDNNVIKKLPKNKIVFSVPNYMCVDHHRTYNDENFIEQYYENILKIYSIESFNVGGPNIIYVIDAIIL